jgi:hypothetical protein
MQQLLKVGRRLLSPPLPLLITFPILSMRAVLVQVVVCWIFYAFSAKKKKKLRSSSPSSMASASMTQTNGNMRPPSASPLPRFNSGSFLSVAGGARVSSGAQAGIPAISTCCGIFWGQCWQGRAVQQPESNFWGWLALKVKEFCVLYVGNQNPVTSEIQYCFL